MDDLPETLAVLTEQLQALGLVVDAQPSGSAALQQAQAELAGGRAYDLMLVDWRMAPPDGLATLQALRQLLGPGMPPSILMTAYNEPVVWQQARAAAVDAVLVKPITPSALHDTLVQLQRRQGKALPAPTALPGEAEALVLQRHGGQRLLLAEDNPVNREMAEELLARVGLVVESAEDGARAVALALARRYDLVLMDMQMPVQDGLAATGLDPDAALANLGGDLPLYSRLLHRFAGTYRQGCAGLADGSDPRRWAAECHSLRGACSAIGAVALAAQAAALEQALLHRPDPASLAPQLPPLQAGLADLVRQLADQVPVAGRQV